MLASVFVVADSDELLRVDARPLGTEAFSAIAAIVAAEQMLLSKADNHLNDGDGPYIVRTLGRDSQNDCGKVVFWLSIGGLKGSPDPDPARDAEAEDMQKYESTSSTALLT